MKHIFFDLDRTLWDFESNSHETLIEICIKYKLNKKGVNDFDSFIREYKENNEMLWYLYRKNQISQKDLRRKRFEQTLNTYKIFDPKLAESIGEDYVNLCPKKTKLFPFVTQVLEYLFKKYSLHIITNGFEKVQHIKLKHSDLQKYFQHIVTSEQIGVKKPNPKIFEFALKCAGAHKEESVYIGDDLIVDILGCQNYGIDGVYFNPEVIQHRESPKYEIRCISELEDLF